MKTNQLNYLTAVLRLREVVGGVGILQAIYNYSKEEWTRCRNANTDEHLIKNVHHSSLKTEAVRTYVSKLAKLYLESWGAQPSCWTKQTLMAENAITKRVIDAITNTTLLDNDQLFGLVATRVLGIDQFVVAAVVSEGTHARYSALVNYFGYTSGETEETDPPASVYESTVTLLNHLGEHRLLNDELFTALVQNGIQFFEEEPESDLDILDLFDTQLHELVQADPQYAKVYAAVAAEEQARG